MDRANNTIIWEDTSEVLAMIGTPGLTVTIIIHKNPDGDAVGSSLALTNWLTRIGHEVGVVSPGAVPGFLAWMPGIEKLIVYDSDPFRADELIVRSQLIIGVDFNDLTRIDHFSSRIMESGAYKLLIDHHPEPKGFFDCILSDTTVSSTAELLLRFLQRSGYSHMIDKDMATCLFTGIMTDTGCFSYNCSGRQTFEAAAVLMDYDIDKDLIYDKVYDNFSSNRMRLMGFSLNERMEVVTEYNTAYIWLTQDDLARYDFRVGDTEGFVNLPLSIAGIRFTALFTQQSDRIRISFRSKGDFAVNVFSERHFNGGGHKNASGGESFTGMEDTLRQFRKLLEQYREELTGNGRHTQQASGQYAGQTSE